MATVVNLDDADTPLAGLIARMEQGEDIVIARGVTQIAKLVPVKAEPLPGDLPPRVPGRLKGLISIPDNFFDPMTEEELALWEGK